MWSLSTHQHEKDSKILCLMSLMTGNLLRLPGTIFRYPFDNSHESVKYRRYHLPYLLYDFSLP